MNREMKLSNFIVYGAQFRKFPKFLKNSRGCTTAKFFYWHYVVGTFQKVLKLIT